MEGNEVSANVLEWTFRRVLQLMGMQMGFRSVVLSEHVRPDERVIVVVAYAIGDVHVWQGTNEVSASDADT